MVLIIIAPVCLDTYSRIRYVTSAEKCYLVSRFGQNVEKKVININYQHILYSVETYRDFYLFVLISYFILINRVELFKTFGFNKKYLQTVTMDQQCGSYGEIKKKDD